MAERKIGERSIALVSGIGYGNEALFCFAQSPLIGVQAAQIIFGDVAFIRPGILGSQLPEGFGGFLVLGVLRRVTDLGSLRWRRTYRRLLYPKGMCQRLLPHRVRMSSVKHHRKNDSRNRHGNRSVADNFRMMLFEEIDGMPHFESKLVGLQLFTRDSSH